MSTRERFRVVGVRSNGKRVVISQHDSREVAEKVVRLIEFGSPFKELLIEGGPDGYPATSGGKN
ncbi:MAG: hypothetical protein HY290_31660 [Planctomycetia bacterium]|nr:hypothetical protein [Planctomycetia bacterium]